MSRTAIMKTPNKTSPMKVNFDPADTAKVQREMYAALKARREALEEVLRKHTEELKMLCIKEGELTGVLPRETPLAPGEEPPVIRRRVGTAFTLSSDVVSSKDKTEDETLKQLELELELQKQITSAAHKLASDKSVSRFVRKQRRHSFIKAQTKLKDMEKKLHQHQKGSTTSSPSQSRYDGMYHVRGVEGDSPAFCDDTYVTRTPKSRHHHVSVAHRLSRSFREKNLLRFNRLIDAGVKTERNSSVIHETSVLSQGSVLSESQLEESRLADQTHSDLDTSRSSAEDSSYKISSDSLYHSSYKYIPEESLLELSFLTPPPVPKRREKVVMSPNTRRSKRASWHHTMFQKTSPQVPRAANKETAV